MQFYQGRFILFWFLRCTVVYIVYRQKINYSNLCIRFDIWKVRRLKLSRFSVEMWETSGGGKRRNEFTEWHVAWLAEWHNYAECKIWKMAQRNKLNWKAVRAPFLAPIWVSNCFTGPFITGGSNQQGRAEGRGKLYCIPVYVILN